MDRWTPGPWQIYQDRNEDGEPDSLHVGTVTTKMGQTPQYVADICAWGGPCEESAANAQLIASVPELVRALVRIRNMALSPYTVDMQGRWQQVEQMTREVLQLAGVQP